MKKTVKIIAVAIAVLLSVSTVSAVGGTYIRGNINKYSLPTAFQESLQQVSAEREKDNIRIMTSNLLVHYKSWGGTPAKPRAKMYFEMLDTYKPDVVALQEVCDEWYSCILRNKGSYEMLFPLTTGTLFRMTSLIYNTDTLDLIAKGQEKYDECDDARLRRLVWGVFEDKNTKEQFAVISTHFDLIRPDREDEMLSMMRSQKEQIIKLSEQLKDEYDVPVFCTGDFNAMNNGGDPIMDAPIIYDELCEKLTDTKDIAKEKQSGDAFGVDDPTWDHIFVKGDAEIMRYAIVSPKALSEMSDHYPIFADIKIGQ